jgi:flagellar P-ring protein precursor FlgI
MKTNIALARRVILAGLPAFACLLTGLLPGTSRAWGQVRIKDLTSLAGEHANQLVGLGLVTGLAGTGGQSTSTKRLAINLLDRLGVRADPVLRAQIANAKENTDNLSVVVVTATLPPHAQPGQQIDAIVSTFDDAESLQGGQLIFTPLSGADGEVYAIAAGSVSIGGFSFSGEAATVAKNHATAGKVPNGATVERGVCTQVLEGNQFRLLLKSPDYETARRIAAAIDQHHPGATAVIDPATVGVRVPLEWLTRPHEFIASVGSLPIQPDAIARVVVNERTGTVVVGEHVRLSQVLITHANLVVSTTEIPQVSQPLPFSEGTTEVVPRTRVDVVEEGTPVNVIEATATVGDLARALNALGVTPRDLSAIFQQLKESGALHADLVFN